MKSNKIKKTKKIIDKYKYKYENYKNKNKRVTRHKIVQTGGAVVVSATDDDINALVFTEPNLAKKNELFNLIKKTYKNKPLDFYTTKYNGINALQLDNIEKRIKSAKVEAAKVEAAKVEAAKVEAAKEAAAETLSDSMYEFLAAIDTYYKFKDLSKAENEFKKVAVLSSADILIEYSRIEKLNSMFNIDIKSETVKRIKALAETDVFREKVNNLRAAASIGLKDVQVTTKGILRKSIAGGYTVTPSEKLITDVTTILQSKITDIEEKTQIILTSQETADLASIPDSDLDDIIYENSKFAQVGNRIKKLQKIAKENYELLKKKEEATAAEILETKNLEEDLATGRKRTLKDGFNPHKITDIQLRTDRLTNQVINKFPDRKVEIQIYSAALTAVSKTQLKNREDEIALSAEITGKSLLTPKQTTATKALNKATIALNTDLYNLYVNPLSEEFFKSDSPFFTLGANAIILVENKLLTLAPNVTNKTLDKAGLDKLIKLYNNSLIKPLIEQNSDLIKYITRLKKDKSFFTRFGVSPTVRERSTGRFTSEELAKIAEKQAASQEIEDTATKTILEKLDEPKLTEIEAAAATLEKEKEAATTAETTAKPETANVKLEAKPATAKAKPATKETIQLSVLDNTKYTERSKAAEEQTKALRAQFTAKQQQLTPKLVTTRSGEKEKGETEIGETEEQEEPEELVEQEENQITGVSRETLQTNMQFAASAFTLFLALVTAGTIMVGGTNKTRKNRNRNRNIRSRSKNIRSRNKIGR